MAFVPHGKKAMQKKARAAKQEALEQVIDRVVGRAQLAMPGRGLCLPLCVLVQRMIKEVMPAATFHLRLGALNVVPTSAGVDPVAFDPRGPDGIDGGFHAWLEDDAGRLLDPSIIVTLAADGYEIDPTGYFFCDGRRFPAFSLEFFYELLPDLKLVGVDESEPHLARLLMFALFNTPVTTPGHIFLDVVWS